MTEARRTLLPDEKFRRTGAESIGPNWLPDGLGTAPEFGDAIDLAFPENLTLSVADCVGHLSTQSGYLQLAPPDRAEVLRRIEAALPPEINVHRELGSTLPAGSRVWSDEVGSLCQRNGGRRAYEYQRVQQRA